MYMYSAAGAPDELEEPSAILGGRVPRLRPSQMCTYMYIYIYIYMFYYTLRYRYPIEGPVCNPSGPSELAPASGVLWVSWPLGWNFVVFDSPETKSNGETPQAGVVQGTAAGMPSWQVERTRFGTAEARQRS